MQRQIRFTHTGSSAVFGNFQAGDTLRLHADAARHFVEEARCAEYADAPVQTPAPVADVAPEAASEAAPAATPDTAAEQPVTKQRRRRA